MKKEVIYFDAAAYGPFAKCELINEYLESDYRNMDEEVSDEIKKKSLDQKISEWKDVIKQTDPGISKYAYGNRKKIKLDESKILYFWKRIYELNVWNWNKRYEDEMAMTDGYTWEVKLRNRDGRSKYSTGYEQFPKTFKKFVDELNKLFETKIAYWDL